MFHTDTYRKTHLSVQSEITKWLKQLIILVMLGAGKQPVQLAEPVLQTLGEKKKKKPQPFCATVLTYQFIPLLSILFDNLTYLKGHWQNDNSATYSSSRVLISCFVLFTFLSFIRHFVIKPSTSLQWWYCSAHWVVFILTALLCCHNCM